MTKSIIKLLDIVALADNLPEYNLYRGQVGAVVELLAFELYIISTFSTLAHIYL
ncbi:DUF4926 domain-containing protein [Nostoc punctiforme UO1]|uniref:DUF4926 domain-containing protein n=1 Tax=Nostoc punctiforme TaxID=272131 RepID=UPI0030B3D610